MKALLNLFRRRSIDRDVADEIQSHIEEKTAELIESGISEREARSRAHREFGNAGLITESSRAVWGWTWLERLGQDLRYALRMMVRTPGFTAVALLSLALGIGANTAIFGLLDVILLRTLPVDRPEELQLVSVKWKASAKPNPYFSYPAYQTLRDNNHTLSGLAATGTFTWRDRSFSGDGVWRAGTLVSGNYFDVLGVPAAIGRTLTAEDDAVEGQGRADGTLPAVLSYTYWRRAYNRDPGVIGRAINVNGAWATVVGVAAPGFFGIQVGYSPDVFVPMLSQPVTSPPRNILHDTPQGGSTTWLTIMGRFKPGVAESSARADLSVGIRPYEITRQGPADRAKGPAAAIGFEPGGRGLSRVRDRFSDPLKVLMALVGIVLLIACANLANLLTARTGARRREIAVRLAIGASRARIVRQLFTESLLLALAGGGLGLLFAFWSSGLLIRMLPVTQVPVAVSLTPDARLLAFTFSLSVLTALLFGVAPALRETWAAVQESLRQTRGHSGRAPRFDFSKALVVVQIALAAPLLVGAGLFIATLRNLVTQEAGFFRQNVVQVRFGFDAARIPQKQWDATYVQLLDRVKAAPGVRAASLANRGVMEEGRTQSGPLNVPGYTFAPGELRELPETYIGTEYFSALGIPLRLGRFFTPLEEAGGAGVVIVNETMAQRYFAGRNPIGLTYSLGSGAKGIEIVGVVADAKYNDFRESSVAMAYYPWRQVAPVRLNSVVVRTQGDTASNIQSLRHAFASVHPDLFQQARTLDSQIDESLVRERMLARLSGFLGLLALLVASVGLYGVLSYGVTRRTAEIGVRVALGARPSSVAAMVFRQTVGMVAIGVVLGTALSIALSRLAKSFLYGLEPNDPMVVAASAVILAIVAVAAAYLPARRASRVDPLVALRHE
jgi:predicted permease